MTDPILTIHGEEQSQVDPTLADAGLPPSVGVRSYQVFRASQATKPDNGKGWTYHHHVDMACWKGRLYVGWNSCERDEDVWPARELYASSTDGRNWTEPAEMFPQGISTCLRMYFYLVSNGRMLLIAGLRRDTTDTDEDTKGGLVVRELRGDHTLGPVFKLRRPSTFEESNDPGFIAACRQLLADRVYLEQQDRGRLLNPAERMKWHDAANWPGGKVPGDNEKWVAGKAYSFFRRPDGLLVGVSKMGWVTTSSDEGQTWSQPAVPPTLVTGKAKVWTQQTHDGRFALVYNPSTRNRFPLAIVTGDDGANFDGMRIVQGELPQQRYPGLHRSIGPQYVRGISKWSDDGSRSDEKAMWLVYSMSKEDIWVSRVPLPVMADLTGATNAWNVYSPKWSPVSIDGEDVTLENRDPFDYSSATHLFPGTREATISFEVIPEEIGDGTKTLEIDVVGKTGSTRPIRLRVSNPQRGKRISYVMQIDVNKGRYTVTKDGAVVSPNATFVEPCDLLNRITFRTGGFRNIGGANPVDPQADRPQTPIVFTIPYLRVQNAG